MPENVQHIVMWLIPLAPLAAAIVTALLGPGGMREKSHLPCWFGLAVAAVCAYVLLWSIVPAGFAAGGSTAVVAPGYQWLDVGGMNIKLDLRADAMTAIMLSMVTLVSLLVSVFAAGYMHGDPGYPRFFACFSFFVFSMCMLVLSSSFLELFIFWEGVGLCSYLLVGFWYQKPSAAAAAKKAFVVNRIGDFGFLTGIFLVWTTFHSMDFSTVLGHPEQIAHIAAAQPGRITAICLLLLLGAMGKSAQFPLHVWLPDAMEGPTPVSALIHAATMVTAGVYMIARCTPLFVNSQTAQIVVSCVGGFTALLAALIALTQNDLKRVLAYSTVSQLGYMFMALGAAAAGGEAVTLGVTAGMFHLYTHAFFKALLFLAAGSVMHSMGDVIDMRRFSGLRHSLPITHWTFLCGAVALAGVPLFSGFWSKDAIFASLYTAAHVQGLETYFWLVFLAAVITAFLTAFYTFRAYFLTFWGDERFPEEAGHHPHDAPPVMAWPLRILAIFALVIGGVVALSGWFSGYLNHAIGLSEVAEEGFAVGMVTLSVAVVVAGIGLAWIMYIVAPGMPARVAAAMGPLYRASLNKFYFDEIFWGIIVAPLRGLAWLSSWFDRSVIDSIVDGLALVPRLFSSIPLIFQNGRLSSYAMVMWIGLLVCLVFAMRLMAG
ncbi:MAG TPA: NADH-quinone oxidoreductase subunit L [Lacipirellulaceae bacterium]|jgi:NADH-quinone oxidoreductase subunit L|nr:NADH-quinone oxidoreductase subunit L [Lacipirellulaceae bacterium]